MWVRHEDPWDCWLVIYSKAKHSILTSCVHPAHQNTDTVRQDDLWHLWAGRHSGKPGSHSPPVCSVTQVSCHRSVWLCVSSASIQVWRASLKPAENCFAMTSVSPAGKPRLRLSCLVIWRFRSVAVFQPWLQQDRPPPPSPQELNALMWLFN